MSTAIPREKTTQAVGGKNPFNAFSIVCHYNNDLQIVSPGDAETFINKQKQQLRIQILSALTGTAVAGLGAAKFLPGSGFLRGFTIVWLTLAGTQVGKSLGDAASSSYRNAQADIIRRYPSWSFDPRVISFFKTGAP